MTTRLTKVLAREIEHDGQAYRVVVTPDGIRLARKGRQRGVSLTWAQILALGDDERADEAAAEGAAPNAVAQPPGRELGVQPTIAADVLVLMQRATESLSDAAALIDRASDVPASLARSREPPRPSEREQSDWYIEPLLTVKQVSALLGVSTGRVRALPLKAVDLEGQVRYRPAELRRFLAARTQTDRYGRRY